MLARIIGILMFMVSIASAADTTIRFKYGNEANIPVLQQGEPAFTLDTNRLFVGGVSGNKLISVEACGPNGPYDGKDGVQGIQGVNGTNGKTYTCMIDSGPMAWIYDAVGLNPQPDMFPYTAKLYENGLLVTPTSYKWDIPRAYTLLSFGNTSTASTFLPNRFVSYTSAKGNNYVAVAMTYAGITCRATNSIAVSKVGAPGVKGDPGAPGTTSQAQILDLLEQPGGHALFRQPLSPQTNSDIFFQQLNLLGSTTWMLAADGTMSFKDPATGYVRVKINTTTYALEMRDANNVLRYSVDTYGQRKTYRGDGVKVSFENTTTAVIIR